MKKFFCYLILSLSFLNAAFASEVETNNASKMTMVQSKSEDTSQASKEIIEKHSIKDKLISFSSKFCYKFLDRLFDPVIIEHDIKNNDFQNDNNIGIVDTAYLNDKKTTEDIEYQNYSNIIKEIIFKSLPTEEFSQKKIAEIAVLIRNDGKIKDSYIIKSSGCKLYDGLVLESIKKCAFPSFQPALENKKLTFYYMVGSAYDANKLTPTLLPLYKKYKW